MSDLDRKTDLDWQLDRPAWTELNRTLTGLDWTWTWSWNWARMSCANSVRFTRSFAHFFRFQFSSLFFAQFRPCSHLSRYVPSVCLCVFVLFAGHWPSRGNNFYAVALVKLAWQSPQGGEWEWRMRTLWMLKDAADAGVARGLGQNKVKCI